MRYIWPAVISQTVASLLQSFKEQIIKKYVRAVFFLIFFYERKDHAFVNLLPQAKVLTQPANLNKIAAFL